MAKRKKKDAINTVRIALWLGLFLVGLVIVSGAMQRKSEAAIKDIVVDIEPLKDGFYLLNEEDIPLIIEDRFAHPLTAFNVGQVDVERLERVLEEDPFVLKAEAFIDADGKVNINIVQREPILRIKDNNDLDYYLDKDGNQMPPSKHHAARVRIVTGTLPPYEDNCLTNEIHLLHHIFELNNQLRADEFLDALVEQIYVNKRGELILSPKVGRQTILFGRYQNAEDKLKRLKVFYREGLPYKGWKVYKSFDLRYDGQVVCVKR